MQSTLLSELYHAYYCARKHKRNTLNQLAFEYDLSKNIHELYDAIRTRTYEPLHSIAFIVEEPVKREVFAANFRDRVVHHWIFNHLNPVLDNRFITDCYSCREGKGTLFGIRRLEHHVRSCSENHTKPCYVLKFDIEGYFMRMNRKILYQQLERHLEKPHPHWQNVPIDLVKYLIRKTIFNDPTKDCRFNTAPYTWTGLPKSKSLFYARPDCGLPIGNLTSQLFSNVYMGDFDNFVKHKLKCKHYGRYVDDFYILSTSEDPEYYRYLRREIDKYLHENLELNLHPKKHYFQHYSKGIPFLGVVVYPYHTVVNRRNKKNFLKATPNRKKDYRSMFLHHNSFGILNG
ncbi:MAG: RNA-directed DNA polymerase [Bacteroidales bacterium]|nr:RNA-directed DNA polymerase [Bacteroidales bacterium]